MQNIEPLIIGNWSLGRRDIYKPSPMTND